MNRGKGHRLPKQTIVDVVGLYKFLRPREISEILHLNLQTVYNILWRSK